MTPSNIVEDLAAIAYPLPRFEDIHIGPRAVAEEIFNDQCEKVMRERQELISELMTDRVVVDEESGEPIGAEEGVLLGELARAREEARNAQRRLRLLLAYGREFQGRRPFPLKWLAEASGLSPSGVRTAYDVSDIERVAEVLEIPVPARTQPSSS